MGHWLLCPVPGPEAADGGLGILPLQPVRQEEKDPPLCPVVTAVSGKARLRDARKAQERGTFCLLRRGEEVCLCRGIPPPGLLRPI